MKTSALTNNTFLTVAIVSLVISGTVSGLTATIFKSESVLHLLDIVEIGASASTNVVQVTIRNTWDKEVNVKHVIIHAIRNATLTYVDSVQTNTTDVVTEVITEPVDVVWDVIPIYEQIETYSTSQPSVTLSPPTIPRLIYEIEESFGECSPDCKGCLIDILPKEWDSNGLFGTIRQLLLERHQHQRRTYELMDDVDYILTPVVADITETWQDVVTYVNVSEKTSTFSFEVRGIYDANVGISPSQSRTFEISLIDDQISGYKIDLEVDEYIIATFYDSNGMWLGEAVMLVGT